MFAPWRSQNSLRIKEASDSGKSFICFQIWELEGRAKLPRYRSRDEYSRQKGRNVCEKLQTVDEYPVIWADNAELTVRENKTNENNAMFGVRNANTRMENYLLFAYSQ